MDNIFHCSQGLSESDLLKTYIYLERYVNDGSPSGFDLCIPNDFSPFNQRQYFELPVYIDKTFNHIQVGSLPAIWPNQILSEDEIPIPIHPAVLNKILKSCPSISGLKVAKIRVQPTSSGRTVLWDHVSEHTHFIKLHYPELIGRFSRDLSLYKWLSIIEKAKELHIHRDSFPKSLGFLYDFGGIYFQNPEEAYGFGVIFRDINPTPGRSSGIKLLIPSFSLFSKSRLGARENPVLIDVLEIIGKDPKVFFDTLLRPAIDAYCYLSFDLGLIPEFNAQNLLYEFDIDTMEPRIIFRDVGDVFVDYDVRNHLSKHTNFCTYKTLDPCKDNDIHERRSFAFDFKLSQYVLKPMVELFSAYASIPFSTTRTIIRDYFHSKCHDIEGYFGNKKHWYAYPDQMYVGRTSYIKIEDPLFR